jgi:hypothetical protein
MRILSCLFLVAVWVEFSIAQFPNFPINNTYTNQGQPQIAVSPTYQDLLLSGWPRVN